MNRRDYLKIMMAFGAQLSVNPLYAFNPSASSTSGAEDDVYYIYIHNVGAPPRWYFDLMMGPKQSPATQRSNSKRASMTWDSLENGEMALNAFSHSGKYGTYTLPYLWSRTIPSVDNSGNIIEVPMSNLLDNSMFIRGNDMQIDGHSISAIRQQVPSGGLSIGGVVADSGKTPFKACGRAFTGFNSAKGINMMSVTTSVDKLLESFRFPNEDRSGIIGKGPATGPNQDLDSVKNKIFKYLGAARKKHGDNKEIDAIYSTLEMAIGMFDKAEDLETVVKRSSAYAKIIKYSLSQTMEGISSEPVIRNNNNPAHTLYNFSGTTDLCGYLDRMCVGPMNGGPENSFNLGASTGLTSSMALQFAVAEYLLVNKLTNTFMMDWGSSEIWGVNFATTGGATSLISNDAHNVGAVPSVIFFSHYYRALAGCIHHLRKKLAAAGIWDKTVVHVGGDFGRSARQAGDGSDHGAEANSISVFSGRIDGPIILGNVVDKIPGHRGSYGQAAPMKTLGNRIMLMGNVSSTVLETLGLPWIMKNDMALVKNTGGKVVPLTSEPEADNIS